MSNIVDVTRLKCYPVVKRECAEYAGRVRKKYWDLIVENFQLGKFLNEHVETEYAQAVVQKLATEVQLSESLLYRVMQFGRKFDTLDDLQEYRLQFERSNFRPLTWTDIRRNVLPDPTKRPEHYGGRASVADQVMRETEHLAGKLEQLREMLDKGDLDTDKKLEIAGSILQVSGVMNETALALAPENPPAAEVPRSGMYLDYIRKLPCMICDGEAVPHHVDAGGVGMKGSDYVTLPLCGDHHRQLHDGGKQSFEQLHGVDLDRLVIKCLASFVQILEDSHEV